MPAMHLMSVDLPAPLSPTRAITSPERATKSTSCRAWTEPKDFETPRSSRRGGCSLTTVLSHKRTPKETEATPKGPPPPHRSFLLAVLRVVAVADVALLQETRREEELVVRLRDRLRLDQVGLLDRPALC